MSLCRIIGSVHMLPFVQNADAMCARKPRRKTEIEEAVRFATDDRARACDPCQTIHRWMHLPCQSLDALMAAAAVGKAFCR